MCPTTRFQPGVDYSSLRANDLLSLCVRGDADGWTEFVRRFHPLIASVVLRVAQQRREPSPRVVEDLVQETYWKLSANRGELGAIASLMDPIGPNLTIASN